jgi:hypothetical protein
MFFGGYLLPLRAALSMRKIVYGGDCLRETLSPLITTRKKALSTRKMPQIPLSTRRNPPIMSETSALSPGLREKILYYAK